MRVAPTLEAGQAASDRDIAVEFLRSIIGARGAGRRVPSAEARNALLAMVAAWQAPADAPADLHGTPCAQSAPDWHLHNLLNLAEQAHPDVEATFARRLYHARWLGYLLFGDRDEFRPVVTILIPVYNRARLVLDAIESCLAQTWRPLEILVVDDGSTDDLAGALAGFSAAVRLIRKDNGGVSSARNLGIQAAKGDLIHFLDSDNLLMPPSVARKVEAFARIADAEFCRNLAEVQDSAALPPVPRARVIDHVYPISVMLGTHLRPTLFVSCVMIPRFTLLAVGGFDEDMRRSEDTQYWLRLALRDTKAIRIDAKLALRRVREDSLSLQPKPPSHDLLVAARTARRCLPDPRFWPVVANCIAIVGWFLTRHEDESPINPISRGAILDLVAAIHALESAGGMTPLPLLAQCRHVLAGPIGTGGDERLVLLQALRSAVHGAALRAAPLTSADLRHWRDTPVTASANSRLNAFCGQAVKEVTRSAAVLPLVDELLRHRTGIPKQRVIPRYLTLRKRAVPRWLALKLAG